MEPSAADNLDEVFSEDAIEQAYQQALRASEEAGVVSPPPEWTPSSENQLSEANSHQAEPKEKQSRSSLNASGPRFSPEQIVEALLFVGGERLPARKIAGFLGENYSSDAVRDHVDALNSRYDQQGRPYEIILGKEGYQMSLRSEFQKQRHFVFGQGPREVKLGPEALEVLAMVAYQQPITKTQLTQLDRNGVMSTVRQLIRRELISTTKREDGELEYRTTDRFLTVFGLKDLTDLPRTRDLTTK